MIRSFGQTLGQPVVVALGQVRLFVAAKPEVPDLGLWQDRQRGVGHAQPRPQNRHQPDPRRHLDAFRALHGSLKKHRSHREIGRRLVDHQRRQLVDELPKELGVRAAIRQDADLVAHQWMPADMKIRKACVGYRHRVSLPSAVRSWRHHPAVAAVRQVPRWRGDSTRLSDYAEIGETSPSRERSPTCPRSSDCNTPASPCHRAGTTSSRVLRRGARHARDPEA